MLIARGYGNGKKVQQGVADNRTGPYVGIERNTRGLYGFVEAFRRSEGGNFRWD